MSADVWIVRDRCNACGRGGDTDESLNITYNLTGMLTAAGFHGWTSTIVEDSPAGDHLRTSLGLPRLEDDE